MAGVVTFRPVHAILDEPADDQLALVAVDPAGAATRHTFGDLAEASRRVASWLAGHGVGRGDRVVVVLPQRVESPLVHAACSRIGAIATPLSPLFGADGLASRLADAQPALIVTLSAREAVLGQALDLAGLPDVPLWFVDEQGLARAWREAPPLAAADHAAVGADDPAFLVYTSGTTSKPKGVLLPHRVVDGRLPGLLATHPSLGPDSLFYSPADWSWIGGLLDSLFGPWAAGCPVLAHERHGALDLDGMLRLWVQHGVTDAFMPPTAVKALAAAGAAPEPRLRALHCAGEPLAAPVADWAAANLAESVCNVFGLSEAAFLCGTGPGDPAGVLGRPFAGHQVRVQGGELVVGAGSPTLMLGYWQGPSRPPQLPLIDGWFSTGDLVRERPDGLLEYLGRADDMIKSSGYRLGPAEIEACLLHHPAVAECAVVGVPDEALGQSVKAFVRLRSGRLGAPALETELRLYVRERLGAHAQPRAVQFVDELPMTVTGKIQRRHLRETLLAAGLAESPTNGPRS